MFWGYSGFEGALAGGVLKYLGVSGLVFLRGDLLGGPVCCWKCRNTNKGASGSMIMNCVINQVEFIAIGLVFAT